MSPADNTPDFDSMSPEQIMAWMESLAKRQGAYEGFTTAADMQIAEIDPNSVIIDEPGYVPYGEDTKKKPVAAAPAKPAAPTPPAPLPQPVAPPVMQQPAPPPAAPPPPQPAAADATPNFDTMSPDEIMRWMESLAKRQGAYEGFTTSADMQVAEIDPTTVTIDEPGYVPYGEDTKKKPAAEPAKPAAQKPAPVPPAPAPVIPVAPPPGFDAPPTPPVRSQPPAAQVIPPAPPARRQPPALEPLPRIEDEQPTRAGDKTPVDDSLAWLQNLAADQGADIPTMDLSMFGSELPALQPAADNIDPLAWLQGLSQPAEDEEQPTALQPSPPPRPAPSPTPTALDSSLDPMTWLESLARRQGVPGEELTTSADLDIPDFELEEDTGPGYSDYAFEDTSAVNPLSSGGLTDLDDPATWLDQLASGQVSAAPAAASQSDEDVIAALNKGKDVAPEAIADWFNQQFDLAASRDDSPALSFEEVDEEVFDPDAPAQRIELPDWLLEAQGAPPIVEELSPAPPAASAPPLSETIAPPPAVEMPDWLLSDVQEQETLELDIFANTAEEDSVVIDPSDPWVEAFELERTRGMDDIHTMPDWYAQKLNMSGETVELQASALLPERELAHGEVSAVPDWLNVPAFEVSVPDSEGMPDWLLEQVGAPGDQGMTDVLPDWLADVDTQEVPEWLLESVTSEQPVVDLPETPIIDLPPAPVVVQTPPPPAQIVPARPTPPPMSPVPVPASAQIDVAEVLTNARRKVSGGDLDGGLADYEAVIRANAQLETVVADLAPVMQREAKNPAIYRVLGDALMRQGKLQDALDTYRKALNLL